MRDRANPLGQALRSRRLRLDLSQQALAELAGCSTRFVHTAEAGKTSLRLDKLLTLMRALGLGLVVTAGRGEISVADAQNVGGTPS